MRKLSILHTESSTGWGGQEIRILTESTGLIARGNRVVLVTSPQAKIALAAHKFRIPTIELPLDRKNLRGLLTMRRYLKKYGREFDVINTHSSTDSWLVALNCKTLKNMPPLIRTRHVSTLLNSKRSTNWLYQTAITHIVTTGEAIRQKLRQAYGFELQRISSVPTGIDLNYYKPLNKQTVRAKLKLPDRPTIGILATLRDWKGHDDLIDAFFSIKDDFPDWQMLIIGDGPRRLDIERCRSSYGLDNRVFMVGNQKNVPEWLNCLDIFVLPSYGDEGVPQALMQAMACGIAAISTPIGAISEALQDGQTGFMTPPRDVKELASNLCRLMVDTTLREKFSKAALLYSQRFDIEIMLNQMEEIFHSVSKLKG